MASNFITPQQIIDIAFEKADIRTGYFKDSKIEVAEIKYIRPAITEALFNRLNQEDVNLNAHEVALKVIIRKALAHYVGYLAIPSISMQVTNTGVQLPRGQNTTSGSDKQRGQVRDTYIAMGNAYRDEAVKYIEDNIDSFKEYYEHYRSTSNRLKKHKGIIF